MTETYHAKRNPELKPSAGERMKRLAGNIGKFALVGTVAATIAVAPLAPALAAPAHDVRPVAAAEISEPTLHDIVPNLPDLAKMLQPEKPLSERLDRLTGVDTNLDERFGIGGTDLGVTFEANGGYATLYGDTFDHRDPGSDGWRSNVMLHSANEPNVDTPMQFEYAYGAGGSGYAPEVLSSPHDTSENKATRSEWSAIPNDAVQLPNGDIVMSYQSVHSWDAQNGYEWTTNHSGLAISKDGGHSFERTGTTWENDLYANDNPFQMMSMQLDEETDKVYIASTKAGRQAGGMMLQRVDADKILDKSAYEMWNGNGWGGEAAPIAMGALAEPSLRELDDGTWALGYFNKDTGQIVTRSTNDIESGNWSEEKDHLSSAELPRLYGGFIHPASTKNNLVMTVSSWVRPGELSPDDPGRYDVSQLTSTLA